MDPSAAPVLEVFASYQGEGLFVGQPQTFLRLGGCPLRCRYCDTPHSWALPAEEDGWLTPFGTMLRVAEAEYDSSRPIAVTGGEPLIWPGFLRGLRLVAGDRPLHLETSGHDGDTFEALIDLFDHVSLDLKLADDLAPPKVLAGLAENLPDSANDWDALRLRQLQLLVRSEASSCVKLVVVPGTDPDRFQPILDDLARVAPDLALFIAPASPRPSFSENTNAPLGDLDSLERVALAALEIGLEPRILPQMHRVLGVR